MGENIIKLISEAVSTGGSAAIWCMVFYMGYKTYYKLCTSMLGAGREEEKIKLTTLSNNTNI